MFYSASGIRLIMFPYNTTYFPSAPDFAVLVQNTASFSYSAILDVQDIDSEESLECAAAQATTEQQEKKKK